MSLTIQHEQIVKAKDFTEYFYEHSELRVFLRVDVHGDGKCALNHEITMGQFFNMLKIFNPNSGIKCRIDGAIYIG